MAEAQVKLAKGSLSISRFFPPSPEKDAERDLPCPEQDVNCDPLVDLVSSAIAKTPTKDKSGQLKNVIPTPDSTPTKESGLTENHSQSDNEASGTFPQSSDNNDGTLTDSPKPTQPKQSRNDTKTGKKSSRVRSKGQGKKSGTDAAHSEVSSIHGNNHRQIPSRTSKNKKSSREPVQSHLVTEYFPIRRSGRRTKSDVLKDKQRELEEAILSKCVDGLKVEMIEGKGRGVMSCRPFSRGEFVVEYEGDLVDLGTAKGREKRYQDNPELGCYMYYFTFQNKRYCVDATAETGRLGRLLNHSRHNPNCKTQVVGIDGHPYLILVAARDIKAGEELIYDYGDRSKSSIEAHPWLAC